MVVVLKSGGVDINEADAASHIFGYAAGCDLTRRDHQAKAKETGSPWDSAKGFDHSAPIGAIARAEDCPSLMEATLKTVVNDSVRQSAPLSSMIWSIPEIIARLSQLFELKAGDLIFTGTPEGVGPLVVGDRTEITIGDLPVLSFLME